jgi:hypothetical protein
VVSPAQVYQLNVADLVGVTFTPDLYAAAVAINTQNDLISLLESIPAAWESERIRLYKRMADLTTADGKAQLRPISHQAGRQIAARGGSVLG